MMNNTENLLVIAAEEAAEVSQAISKALRFGLRNNAQQILTEYYQLQAMIEMLQYYGIISEIDKNDIDDIKKSKTAKVKFYNEESKKLGRLQETDFRM